VSESMGSQPPFSFKHRYNGSDLDKILSTYKESYDKGVDKDFCALMIGKIYRYNISEYDINAHTTALKWFGKSSTNSAYFNIASYYENGIYTKYDPYFGSTPIIKKDLKKAVKWYSRAFKATGDKNAKQRLNLLDIK